MKNIIKLVTDNKGPIFKMALGALGTAAGLALAGVFTSDAEDDLEDCALESQETEETEVQETLVTPTEE